MKTRLKMIPGVIFNLKGWVLVPIMVVFMVHRADSAAGSTSICKWKDNKEAAFTMSNDDNYANQAVFIDSICRPRGIKMTWFLETGGAHGPLPGNECCTWGGNWDLWRTMASRGHDIGSHTVTHPCLTDLSAAQIRTELRDSKAKIEQEIGQAIPGYKCLTIAWPSGCNDVTVRTIASEYYIEGRGTSGAGYGADRNPVSPPLNFTDNNWSMWTQGVMSRTSTDINNIISWGGWGNSYWHNVGDYGEFTAFCDYMYSKRDVLWTGSIKEVAMYVYERDASIVQVGSSGQSQIVLNLTHSLSTAVSDFEYPLTLKTEVPSGWDSVTVGQDGSTAVVLAADEAGTKYVYFDARPNNGQITLTPGASTAISNPGPAAWVPTGGNGEPEGIPNPIPAGAWYRYRQDHRRLVAYDLRGKPVRSDAVIKPGIYLVKQAGTGTIGLVFVVP